jgi:hypothetical protein
MNARTQMSMAATIHWQGLRQERCMHVPGKPAARACHHHGQHALLVLCRRARPPVCLSCVCLYLQAASRLLWARWGQVGNF